MLDNNIINNNIWESITSSTLNLPKWDKMHQCVQSATSTMFVMSEQSVQERLITKLQKQLRWLQNSVSRETYIIKLRRLTQLYSNSYVGAVKTTPNIQSLVESNGSTSHMGKFGKSSSSVMMAKQLRINSNEHMYDDSNDELTFQ